MTARAPNDGVDPVPAAEAGSGSLPTGPRDRLLGALGNAQVAQAARLVREDAGRGGLTALLSLARALARACGGGEAEARLEAELDGYEQAELEVPAVRRVNGFASAFPVRALDLGLLDPEEIFSGGNEKFSQVTLTIGQPIAELEQALAQIRSGGVLALKVPASEVTRHSAHTTADTEVYIYILPGEIQKIVDGARAFAFDAIVTQLVDAALAP